VQFPGRHLDTQAPQPLTYLTLLRAVPFLYGAPQIDVAFLVGEDPVAVISRGLAQEVEELPAEGADGLPRLRFEVAGGMMTLHIDPDTHLIRTAVLEMTPSPMLVQAGAGSIRFNFDFHVEQHNEALNDTNFAFDSESTPSVDSLQAYSQFVPPRDDQNHPLIGKGAPTFTLPVYGGGELNTAELDARVILLDFWASWCMPCQVLQPQVDAVDKWVQENDLPVKILTVNQGGEAADKIDAFMARTGADLPILMDEELAVSSAYGVDGLPYSVMIVDGKVAKIHRGLRLDIDYTALLKQEIEEALATPTPAPDAAH
jgi:thiol-disulfide isomerase/thioredoxin